MAAHRGGTGQSAVDFLVSYGFAIIIISVAVYVALQLSIFQPQLVPSYCDAAGGFTCKAFLLSTNGTLYATLVQATGSVLNITGAACSSEVNSTGDGPAFGNIGVRKYASYTQGYPDNSLINGLVMYTDTAAMVKMNCFTGSGLAGSVAGTTFTGYVWLNYTSSGLPSGMHSVESVMHFTAKYS